LRSAPRRGSSQRRLQVAEHEAPFGPIDGRAAHANAGDNVLVAGTAVGRQQNLRPLELARRMLATAQKPQEFVAFGLAQFDPVTYIHRSLLRVRGGDNQLNRMAGVSRPAKTFTPKQGQYLAFIYVYTRLHAETDMRQYFRVSPPSVHQMVLTLERAGFVRKQPGVARSIEMLVDPKHLPVLR
jgi:hypothetical protein